MGQNHEIQFEIFEVFMQQIAAKDGQGVPHNEYNSEHQNRLIWKLEELVSKNEGYTKPSKSNIRDYFLIFNPRSKKYRKLSYSEKTLDTLSLFIDYKSYYEFCDRIKNELGYQEIPTNDLIYNSRRESEVLVDEQEPLKDYLNWLITSYKRIQLPSLGTKLNIPLEKVYVALKVESKVTSYERESALRNFERKYRERLAELEHRPTLHEEMEIQAELLREYPTMRSFFQNDQLESVSATDDVLFDKRANEKIITLAEAFYKHRYLVILGAPGSGKSTLSKWLAIQLAKSFIASLGDSTLTQIQVPSNHVNVFDDQEGNVTIDIGPIRMPILVKVSEYAEAYLDKSISLIDFLEKNSFFEPFDEGEQIGGLIKNHLKTGRAVVILDGLDEVSSQLKPKIQTQIQRFIDTWILTNGDPSNFDSDILLDEPGKIGGNQIVITSRIVGYQNFGLSGDITEVTIQEMEKHAVEHFCDIWMKHVHLLNAKIDLDSGRISEDQVESNAVLESNDLKQAIYDIRKPRIRELATNPLLVTFLAVIFSNNKGTLPESRVELYNSAYEILVHEWRKTPISRLELDQILPVIAAHIHQSPYDYITANEFEEQVKEGLKIARGGDFGAGDVDALSAVIKKDVGLLAEDGNNLFKFLHRTFQEYLAGIYLVSDDQNASDNIIAKLADPIWREPILLGLGFIDNQWSPEKKDSLITQILTTPDPLKDLVPRASLFIALALGEMEKVSNDTIGTIFEELIVIFNENLNKYKYQALNQQIEKALQAIYKGTKRDVFLDLLLKCLDREDLIHSISYLISKNQWINKEIVKRLIGVVHFDSMVHSFPIDQILRSYICNSDAIYRTDLFESLVLKKYLTRNPSFVSVIKKDVGWLRLIISLYGGLSDLQIAEKASEFDRMQQKLRQRIGTSEELHGYAVRLDTEFGPVHKKLNTHPTFSPSYIYRDSPFSRKIIQLLRKGSASTSIQGHLASVAHDKREKPYIRGLALLGLLVTGFDTGQILADLDQDEDLNSKSTLEFLTSELYRVKISLQDSVVRLSHIFRNHKSDYRKEFFGRLPISVRGRLIRNFMEAFIENGSSPINFSHQIEEQRVAEFEDKEDQAYVESEGWAFRLSMCGSHPVYNIAVILDTVGTSLKKPFDIFLMSLGNIHRAKNLECLNHIGWVHNSLPPSPESDDDLILCAMENIEGISNNFDFVKEWLFWSIGLKVSSGSDLFPEIVIRGLKNTVHNRAMELIEDFDSKDKLDDFLLKSSLQINDPYLRFRAIWQLAEYSTEMNTKEPLIKSYYSIENAHDFVLASELLLKSNTDSKIISGGSIIDEGNLEIANVYPEIWQSAWDRTWSIDHPQNKLKAQIRLAGLHVSGISSEYAADIAAGISQLHENQKVELILDAKRYLKDHNILGIDLVEQVTSISNEWMRNEYMDKCFRNHVKLDHLLQDHNNTWSILSLYQLCKDEITGLETEEGQRHSIGSMLVGGQTNQLAKMVEGKQFQLKISTEDVHYLNNNIEGIGADVITQLAPYLSVSGSPMVVQELRKMNTCDSTEFRLLSSLLLAESGELNEVIVADLLHHINFSEDRIRNRAAIAIHGLNTSSNKVNRKWRLSKIGLGTLKFIYNQLDYYSDRDDHANSTRLAWFFTEFIADDSKAIETLIFGGASNNSEIQLCAAILRRIEMITPYVWEVYKKGLKEGSKEVKQGLFQSLCAMVYLSLSSGTPHFPSDAMIDLPKVIQFLPDQFFLENGYYIYTTQAILETVRKASELYSDSCQESIEFCESRIQELTRIDLMNIKSNDNKSLMDVLSRVGEAGFVRTGDVIRNASVVAQEVKERPDLAKILMEWAVVRLQEDLLDNDVGEIGATLCIAVSEYANLSPEQFVNETDSSSVDEFFISVARKHHRWVARRGAVTIISHLGDFKPDIIETIAFAFKDVPFVREGALQAFQKIKKVVDRRGLELLKSNLKSSSALIASESAKLIATIARSEEHSRELRELAIDALSRELRETKNEVLPKQIWVVDKQFSAQARHRYLGDFEQVLYSELIKVSGID